MKNIIGEEFGRLTVVGFSHRKKDKYYWECICECGNRRIIERNSLVKGLTKSCGCLKKELLSKRKKKYNEYKFTDEYGIGILNNGQEFYFDLEDYDKIKEHKWQISKNGYVYYKYGERFKKIQYLHRLIIKCVEGLEIDHIDRNKLDNRKSNLRITTSQNNTINRSLQSNNTSGITGVYWHKSCEKWMSSIKHNQKNKILGYFKNFEEAVIVRLKAEKELFGEFAPQRHLFEKYDI